MAATADDFERADLGPEATIGEVPVVVGRTFADAPEGGLVVYVDSGGHVAVARNGGSALDLLQDPERIVVTAKT